MQSLTEFFDRNTLRWALLFLFVVALFLFMPDAMAGNNNTGGSGSGGGASLLPQGTLAVPGTTKDDAWYKVLIYALRFGLIALLLIALVVGLGDSQCCGSEVETPMTLPVSTSYVIAVGRGQGVSGFELIPGFGSRVGLTVPDDLLD